MKPHVIAVCERAEPGRTLLPRPAWCLCLMMLLAAPATATELFNGKNLDGWQTFLVDTKHADPRGVFTVTNGMIRISGDGLGYLATKASFTNYHLTVEFRWGATNYSWGDRIGKARDSGIFLHATGPDGNSDDGGGAFMAAIECNIFQGATGDFLLIRGKDAQDKPLAPRVTSTVASKRDAENWFTYDPKGKPQTVERWGRINWFGKDPEWRDVTDFRGRNDVEKDGWNTIECICRDGTIEIRLNGITVNRATAVWPRSGKILLQCEGSEIFFRRVTVN